MDGFTLKPNVKPTQFTKILRRFRSQLSDGSINPNQELMRLTCIEGHVFTDAQQDEIAPDGWFDTKRLNDDDEAEFTIIVGNEEITSIFDEETECFYTIEDEPRVFTADEVDEIR